MATNTDFNLMVNAVVDTSKAEQQIANFTKKREIVTAIKIDGEDAIQKVTTLIDNYGRSVKQINQYDLLGNLRSSDIKSVSDNFKSLNTQVTKYREGLNATVTETKKFDEYGNSLTTTVKEYTDALGRSVKETKNFDSSGQQVGETARQITQDLTGIEVSVRNNADAMLMGAQSTEEYSKSFFGLLDSFTGVNLAARVIQDTFSKIKQLGNEAIEVIQNYDVAITEMGKVTEYAGDQLDNYAKRLGEIGAEVGRTTSQMVEGTTGWLKAGFDEEAAANLAKWSALLQNTVDEEITAAEATEILVSQIKGFGEESGNTVESVQAFAEHVSDSINLVSQDFAVSSADISKGLTQAGAAMSTYGNSYDEVVGIITAGTEVMQGRSQQVARGMNMIASRVAKSEKALNEYNISIHNVDGSLKSTYDILAEVAAQWDTMTEEQKISLGTTLSGVNQYKVFAAIMGNFDTAIEACNESMDSAGTTMKQNEIYMDSLAAKTALLKAEFEKLVLTGGILQNTAKGIVDLGTELLSFMNSSLGHIIEITAGIALLVKTLTGLGESIMLTGKGMATYALMAGGMSAENAMLVASNMTLAQSFEMVASAFFASPLGMATIAAAGIALLIKVGKNYNEVLEQENKRLQENADNYKQAKSEVKNLTKQYDDLISRIDELNSKESLTDVESAKLNVLKNQSKELEYQIALAKQKEELARRELEQQAQKVLMEKNYASQSDVMGGHHYTTQTEGLKANAEELKEIANEIIALEEEMANTDISSRHYDKLQSQLDDAKERYNEVKERGVNCFETINNAIANLPSDSPLVQAAQEAIDSWLGVEEPLAITGQTALETTEGFEDLGDETEELVDEIDLLAEANNISADELKNLAKAAGMSEQELINYANTLGVTIEQAAGFAQAISQWNSAIDGLQSAYSTLTGAVEEYNKSGEVSLDTLQALLNLSPEYLSMLNEENGKLVLNEEAILNKANALIEERKQTALQMAYDRLAAIERGENAAAADAQAGSIYGNTDALNTETAALSKNTVEQYANRIARNDKSKGTAASQVVRELEKELKVLDNIGSKYGKVSTAAIKSGSNRSKASKGASKALDDEKKALQDLLADYKTVISWINKQYDRKIKEIQKAKSAAVKGVQDEINALKKREKVELDSITKTINARKSEKKEALDAIELQIKLIEKEEDLRIGSLKKDKKALEKQRDDELDDLQDKIDLLKEQKDVLLDATQTEIDSLKELKEERQAYWDEEINRLKEANEERKDALELQQYLDNLEKAKNTKVKVYKQDEGFVYDTDQTQVNQAQEALDKYLSEKAYEDELARLEALKQAELENYQDRIDALTKFKEGEAKNYQAQIDDLTKLKNERKKVYEEELDALTELIEAEKEQYDIRLELLEEQKDVTTEYYEVMIDELEEYKDTVEESYEQQIEALEAHKDALEDNYDKEIEMYRNYKEQFQDMVDEYENAQAKLLFEQLTGLSAENDNWMTRLDNLRQFVNAYNSLQAQLNTATTNASASYGGTGSVNYKPVATTTTPKTTTTTTTKQYSPTTGVDSKGYNTYGTTSSSPKSTGDAASREALARINHKATTYATGVDKVPDDKVALVGEAPNTELVIGSKINSGKLMSLPKDTGVVNAKSTKSMAGLLNQLGQFGGSAFGAGNGTLNNNTTSNTENFTIDNVSIDGSGIVDPQTFKTALMQMKNNAISRAYRR